jgi:hypothetical protein
MSSLEVRERKEKEREWKMDGGEEKSFKGRRGKETKEKAGEGRSSTSGP